MTSHIEKIEICAKSRKLLTQLLDENPELKKILEKADSAKTALKNIKNWVLNDLKLRPNAYSYYKEDITGREAFEKLQWKDYAAIRILDYIDNADKVYEDLNLRGKTIINNPFKLVWLATKCGTGGAKPGFFLDMIELFRQYHGKNKPVKLTKDDVLKYMERYPSGLDERVIEIRRKNRDRILRIFIDKINKGDINDSKYSFDEGMTEDEKFEKANEWWNERLFHLRFAVRSPELLNEMLDYSLDPDTMKLLERAKKAGIPTFVNPYYLSLLNVKAPDFAQNADFAIRDYVLYSPELIEEFGHIVAWEKEDIVEPGKPNAAGWILPSHHSVHRRYPEVAILIPETVGRACGGLCSSCQRMYDFQSGHLNFNLKKLKPNETWQDRLKLYMKYFEDDSQLRDILITGGDALMSSDKSLKQVLDEIYQMAVRKIEANKHRKEGEKYAEMLRVRLGTRLLAYLPQRITPELTKILAKFKEKASKVGMKQFVIQTHFESPMEITPESKQAIDRLLSAGWIITNQLVFSAAASRRGHTAQLRKVLNDVGVLTYYTFTVKGYMENYHNFATNGRAVQEQLEEKIFGEISKEHYDTIKSFALSSKDVIKNINKLRQEEDIPFLAIDRNVLNLPGVGKSLTFRVVGITRDGRRILEFDHDATRNHSPIIHKMGKVIIIESKSVDDYLKQLDEMGEDISEYEGIYGYSIGETEPRMPIYEYPDFDFETTDRYTNLEIDE